MYKVVVTSALLALTTPSLASAHHQILTADGDPVGWCQPEVVYTVDAHAQSKLGEAGMRALRNAASHWLGLDGVPLIRVELASPGLAEAAQRIEWVDAWETTGYPRNHLAVTESEFYPRGTLDNAPIYVNGRQPWSFSDAGPDAAHVDFESTMAHEFGHALGLEHSADPDSVMRPALDEGEVYREPLDADMAALEDTYARPFVCVKKRSARTEMYSSSSCSATGIRAAMGGRHPIAMMFCGIVLALLQRMRSRRIRARSAL